MAGGLAPPIAVPEGDQMERRRPDPRSATTIGGRRFCGSASCALTLFSFSFVVGATSMLCVRITSVPGGIWNQRRTFAQDSRT